MIDKQVVTQFSIKAEIQEGSLVSRQRAAHLESSILTQSDTTRCLGRWSVSLAVEKTVWTFAVREIDGQSS